MTSVELIRMILPSISFDSAWPKWALSRGDSQYLFEGEMIAVTDGRAGKGSRPRYLWRQQHQLKLVLREIDIDREYAAALLALEMPVVLAGDYNVMPTELDVYKPEHWVDDALFRPEVREAFHALVAQGWTDALRSLHPGERIYTFWDYFRDAWGRNARLRLDHFLLSW